MELHVSVVDGRFSWHEVPADAALLAQIERQVPEHAALPVGYVTEVHSAACGFMATLAQMLARGQGGAAVLLDYGFPAHEYYFDQRVTGTLMCHYRHHAHAEPFYYPGLQDITAHVDFTAMGAGGPGRRCGGAGLQQPGRLPAGRGLGELLLRTDLDDALRYLPAAKAVQKLVSPAEMGELFKALVIGKQVQLPQAIIAQDRSHRL